MSQLTTAQLNYLRNEHPHRVKMYLSGLDPDVVYCGTVAAVPADNYHVEVVDVSGNLANVVEDHAILIGTSCGDGSIARRRYKSRVGQVLEIDESDVDWQVGNYVTVVDTFDLRPKFPYTLTDAPYTFYKDRNIAYTDQNEEPDPVAIAGSHQAGFLVGGSVTFDLPMNGLDESYAIASGAIIVSHLWACDGGAIDNVNAPVTAITFTLSGQYWVSLTVTDDNGKSHMTRRIIFVHDMPDTGGYEPITAFSLQGPITGDWRQGGWSANIQVRDGVTESEFPPGTFVLIWYEVFYDDVEVYLGDSGNVALAGYVFKERIAKEVETGYVGFEVRTIHGLLKNTPLYNITLEYSVSPSEWYEYANLTLARALHHYFHEHSTLLTITDVFLPMSNTSLMPACDDFAEGDMYSQADAVAFMHSIFAHLCCDKMGRLYVETDLNIQSAADRNAATLVMTILDNDRRGDLVIARNPYSRVPLITASGIAFDGAVTTSYISNAPGSVMLTEGTTPTPFERLIVVDQDDLNYMSGRLLAIANADVVELRLNYAGNYFPVLDIVPQEWYRISTSETKRGIPLADRYICRTISADVNIVAGTIFPNVVLEPEIGSVDGVTEGIPPDDPPTDPPDDDPPVKPPKWPPVVHLMTGALVAFDESEGCWYRGPGATDWIERDAGLPAGAVDDDNQGGWDPWWFTSEKQDTTDPAFAILIRCQDAHIYKSVDCGVTWEDVTPTENPPNFYGDVPAPVVADVTFIQRADNIHNNGHHYFSARWQNVGALYRGAILKTTDDCVTWEWFSLGRSPHSPAFAATRTDGLYRSSDFVYTPGDPTWELVGQTPFNIEMFAIDQETGNFQACINALDEIWVRHYTTYGDANWHRVLTLAGAAAIVGHALTWLQGAYINSELPGHMYTLARGDTGGFLESGLYLLRSTDYGVSWVARLIKVDAPITVATQATLGVGRIGGGESPGQVLYVFRYRSAPVARDVRYSTDEGDTWGNAGPLTGFPDIISYITVDPTDQTISYCTRDNPPSNLGRAITIGGGWGFIRNDAALRWDRAWISAIDNDYIRIVHGNDQMLYLSDNYGVAWTDIAISFWSACVWASDGTPSHIATGRGGSGTAGVPHIVRSTDDTGVSWYNKGGANAAVAGTGGGDSIPYDCGGLATHGLFVMEAESLYPIWMDVDSEDGTILWITTWKSGRFYLEKRQTSDLAIIDLIQLGIATQAQMLSRELIAYPHTPLGDHDYAVVFGRMVDPGDINGLQHVILTIDGAATFASVENGWGVDICSAFLASADDGGNRVYTAIKSPGVAYPAELHMGTNVVALVVVLPFGNNRGVLVDALTLLPAVPGGAEDSIACGASVAGAVMVVYAEAPFTAWVNVTNSYPAIGVVRSLTYL